MTRPQALWVLHRLRTRPAAARSAQAELLADPWEPPSEIRDYASSAKLADEARILGIVVSRTPAAFFSNRAALVASRRGLPAPIRAGSLGELLGCRVSVAGTAIAGKEVLTKGGEAMAFYTLEDEEGLIEAVLFPQAYARALPTLEANTAVLAVGIVRSEFGALSLHVEEAYGLNRPDQERAG